MQKIATKVFIVASCLFGVVGICMVLTLPGQYEVGTDINLFFSRLLMALVFVILPSFALSVASKYLSEKPKK